MIARRRRRICEEEEEMVEMVEMVRRWREGEWLGRSVFASGETEPLSRAKIKQ